MDEWTAERLEHEIDQWEYQQELIEDADAWQEYERDLEDEWRKANA